MKTEITCYIEPDHNGIEIEINTNKTTENIQTHEE
jgi:hypothetical protein